MTYDIEISPELREQIIRSVPIRLPDRKADDNIDQILDKQIESEREERRRRAFQKQLELEEQRKDRVEKANWQFVTQGRHKLLDPTKQFQTLFKDGSCPVCNANVKYPLEGWNRNRELAGYSDLTIPYEPTEIDDQNNFTQKHSCHSDDPGEMNLFLKKRIEHLEHNIKTLDKSIDDRIRQAFIINAVGR